MTEEGRLLVAQYRRDRHVREFGYDVGVHGSEVIRRRANRGQRGARHGEEFHQGGRPVEGLEIHQRRARRVGGLRGEDAAVSVSAEPPEQPTVDGAQTGFARLVEVPALEQPLHFRRRKIGVENESGQGAHPRSVSVARQLLAALGGAAILPDDRAVGRHAVGTVKGHRGLALIRNADRQNPVAVAAHARGHLAEGLDRQCGDVGRFVFDPAGFGEVLGQLAVGTAHHARDVIKGDRSHPRGAGVQREDEVHAGQASKQRAFVSASGATERGLYRCCAEKE